VRGKKQMRAKRKKRKSRSRKGTKLVGGRQKSE